MTKLIDEIKQEDSFDGCKLLYAERRRLASEKSNLENAISIAKHEFVIVKLNEGESEEERATAIWAMERKIEAINIVVKEMSDALIEQYAEDYRSEVLKRIKEKKL